MKKKTPPKETKGPTIAEVYETEIEYTCPVRGKVKQKVKVKRLEKVEYTAAGEVLPNKSVSEKLDLKYSGLMLEDDLMGKEEEGSKE